jgi:hypothetical protein
VIGRPAVIRGVVGQIRWAYYVAAGVEGYTVVRNQRPASRPGVKATWSLKARIVGSDKFKMAQRPLLFVAPHAKGRWMWPIEDFVMVQDELTARLGPVEEY